MRPARTKPNHCLTLTAGHRAVGSLAPAPSASGRAAVDPELDDEWVLIDSDGGDRFGHAGDTIIPGAGTKWKHLRGPAAVPGRCEGTAFGVLRMSADHQ